MKTIHVSGKRKRAIARATIKQGHGKVRINNQLLVNTSPKMAQMKLQEPLILAGEDANHVDIDVNVTGGGTMGQADASRLVIAKALVAWTKDKNLENKFLKYDRHLLVADVRRKETRKPNDSKARAKRQKSYR
ncbi:30S ribosomal protein S9 [Candidatus Woesearchaeota archaeon]|nr:30S ribosomal protein S9 [Candidatus Woesearchaeota archaeon]